MKLVTIENEEIRLNSLMDEMAFGKTNYDSIISQAGILAKCDGVSEDKYHFTFEPWSFSEIKSYETEEKTERLVFYCGKSPLAENSKSLLEFFEEAGKENAVKDDKEAMFLASYIICSIYTQAAVENVEIPINGAGGIIIELNGDKTQILFLPANLYKYSTGGMETVESANMQGCWVNPSLIGLPALCFARGVIAYKMLTGRFPYAAANATERNADILDRKFLPLQLSVNGIDETLAAEVNKALKLNSNEVTIPGKKKKGKSNEDLTPTKTFPLELLFKSKTEHGQTKLNDREFEEKANNYLKNQNAKVNTKRKLRRNTATLVVVILSVIVLGFITANTIKSHMDNYTSKGLTSTQTIESYFKGMNEKDTVLMDNMVKGRNPNRHVDTVSQVYVISKQRQAYGHDMGFISPANWLLFATDLQKNKQAGIYGVTNVKIDGKNSNLNPPLLKKSDKPEKLLQENGIELNNKAKSVHNVEYYFIHSEGEDSEITVEKTFEIFTLNFVNDQWRITNIESSTFETNFDNFAFKNEYFSTIKKNDGDVLKTVKQLRPKYDWLPSDYIMQQEKIRFENEMNDTFKALGF